MSSFFQMPGRDVDDEDPIRHHQVDTSPPGFYNCPQSLPHQYTTTSTKVVTWTEPTCYDDRGSCSISRSGPASGSHFSEGYHVITYTARDSAGNTRTCQITFTVVVVRCSTAAAPQHGTVSCSQSTSVGSVCTFSCAVGLTLEGSTQRTCQSVSSSSAQWSGTQPVCADNFAPVITQCPGTINADRTQHWGVEVSFLVPTASDNFDATLLITTEPADLRSPYNFTADTVCKYHFRDDTGNTATCVFNVYLHDLVVPEFLTCPPSQNMRTSTEMTPVTWDEPTVREIPGNEVRVTCNYGSNNALLPWGSNHVVYTATNMKNSLSSICDFTVTIEPMPCMSLRSPAHGALSCDKWAYGRYCSMSCNEDYDIPVPSAFQPATDIYTCGSSGMWSPHSYVPDCSQVRDPTKSNLPTELLYYSGQCTSPTSREDIAKSFIDVISKSDEAKEICDTDDGCSVENVAVVCGWPARRRKRALLDDHTDGKATPDLDRVFDNVTTQGYQPMRIMMSLAANATGPGGQSRAQKKLTNWAQSLLSGILAPARDGIAILREKLDHVTDSDFFMLVGDPGIECEDGYVPDGIACATGHYYDPQSRSCKMCGYGFYQDTDAQLSCLRCPDGQSTLEKGSPDIASCRDQCERGHFSTTGFSPCIQCPPGTFQPLIGQSECFECPDGSRTWTRGATDVEQCAELE
ncbi:sushi, von Willebrand factor type A, EGF and pentraxin domain-containing protein 1-like [Diadema antillarum]|uniref:sushi, von Willebrand factor type A, EGF and pentraxin domain-containing protein 1-like n=1 Tax=Diadema antillarum TaxID=105358 RepID=UPI003A88FCC3